MTSAYDEHNTEHGGPRESCPLCPDEPVPVPDDREPNRDAFEGYDVDSRCDACGKWECGAGESAEPSPWKVCKACTRCGECGHEDGCEGSRVHVPARGEIDIRALDVDDMLAAIGWHCEDCHGTTMAIDDRGGAIRISDRWGPHFAPQGYWSCGSRGPRGRWVSFQDAARAAYAHHVLHAPEVLPLEPPTPDPTLPGIPQDAVDHAANMERARALVDHRPKCVAAHADRVCNCDYDRRRDAIAEALTAAELRGWGRAREAKAAPVVRRNCHFCACDKNGSCAPVSSGMRAADWYEALRRDGRTTDNGMPDEDADGCPDFAPKETP